MTNGQYRLFRPNHDSGRLGKDTLNHDKQPAVHIKLVSGQGISTLVNPTTSRKKFTFRLPTEAGWEHSCRTGSMETDFPPGKESNTCRYANVTDRLYHFKRIKNHDCFDGAALSSQVGSFTPNSAGLHDILGNFWEWCEDRYSRHAYKHHSKKIRHIK